jgi:probable rRNA maturation factor
VTSAPSLELTLRLEGGDGCPLASALAPLLAAAAPLTSGDQAEGHWQALLGDWLGQLSPELAAELRAPAYCLGLLITDDRSIAVLNGEWRQQEGPTDVLAFAAQEAPLPPGALAELGEAEPLELGDIVISLETAARQAQEHDHDLARELRFLASHGLLHLLGWDHPDAASLERMLARQELLLVKAGVPISKQG